MFVTSRDLKQRIAATVDYLVRSHFYDEQQAARIVYSIIETMRPVADLDEFMDIGLAELRKIAVEREHYL